MLSIRTETPSISCSLLKRNAHAAKRFFRKVLLNDYIQEPRVINVDKNPAYPPAVEKLQKDEDLPERTKLRAVKYLNNLIEQDHRFIKRSDEAREWASGHSTQLDGRLRGLNQ